MPNDAEAQRIVADADGPTSLSDILTDLQSAHASLTFLQVMFPGEPMGAQAEAVEKALLELLETLEKITIDGIGNSG